MNKYDLFDALGGVDEDLLERSERKAHRRLSLRKPLIAAAAVMLLAATVWAAPAIRELLFDTETEQTIYGAPLVNLDGSTSYYQDTYMVHFEVENPEELPTTIEEYYIPHYVEGYGWTFDGGYLFSYMFGEETNIRWENEGVPYQWIEFEQASFNQFTDDVEQEPGTNQFFIGSTPGTEVTQTTISTSRGDITGYLAKTTPELGTHYSVNDQLHVFWSNGTYAFHITTSAGMEPEMLAQIIESVGPVEDPTPYLADTGRIEISENPPLENHQMLTVLPEGFTFAECEAAEDRVNWLWENAGGDTIALVQRTADDLDTNIHNYTLEQQEHTLAEMDLDGTTVYFITAEDHVRAMWKGEGCEFDVIWRTAEDVTWEQVASLIRSLEPVNDISEYVTE